MPRLLLLLALLFTTSPCFAFVAGEHQSFLDSTLEAVVAKSDLIVIGTITKTPYQNYFIYKLQIHGTIKCPPNFNETTIEPGGLWFSADDDKAFIGRRLILFLDTFDGRWGWVQDFVDPNQLTQPRSYNSHVIRDYALTPIQSVEQFLTTIRAECKLQQYAQRNLISVSSDPFPLNWMVDDSRLDAALEKWPDSPDPQARYLAARIFELRNNPADIPRIRKLLADPYTNLNTHLLCPWSRPDYVIRQAAAEAMTKRGIPFDPPAYTVANVSPYQRVPLTLLPWIPAIPLAVFLLAYFACRKWFPSTRRVPSLRFLFLASVTIPAFIAAIVAWHRSSKIADDLVFANTGVLLQATSINGYLFLEVATNWPETTNLCHLAITPDHTEGDEFGDHHDSQSALTVVRGPSSLFPLYQRARVRDYYDPRQNPKVRSVREYATVTSFLESVPNYRYPHASGNLRIPSLIAVIRYPILLPLLLLPLALHLAAPIPANLRRRARLRRGLCPNCSYDLRATPTPNAGLLPTCPECGQQIQHQNHHI